MPVNCTMPRFPMFPVGLEFARPWHAPAPANSCFFGIIPRGNIGDRHRFSLRQSHIVFAFFLLKPLQPVSVARTRMIC